jgi:hypothetical protein
MSALPLRVIDNDSHYLFWSKYIKGKTGSQYFFENDYQIH